MADFHIPRYEELPEFPLLSEQVIQYIENKLSAFFYGEEKIFTKAMINNYVKQGIVSAPQKKRYTREHMVYFIVLCLLKQTFSLDEVSYIISNVIQNVDIVTSYNYFCDEMEACLVSIFRKKKITHTPYYSGKDELVYICQNIVMTTAHKIYCQYILSLQEQNDESH